MKATRGAHIPHHFPVVLRNRKRQTTIVVLQALALIHQLGMRRVPARFLADSLLETKVAMGGVNMNFILGITGEQSLLPLRQIVLVLLVIRGGDYQDRLLIRIGIRALFARTSVFQPGRQSGTCRPGV